MVRQILSDEVVKLLTGEPEEAANNGVQFPTLDEVRRVEVVAEPLCRHGSRGRKQAGRQSRTLALAKLPSKQ